MISQTVEYALRAVVYLATVGDSPVSRSEIAAATSVSPDYLAKVLQELDRGSIVTSQRGRGGGYLLKVDPNTASVLDIVNVVSELPRIRKCPLGLSEHAKLCPLHKRLDEAAELVENAFRDTKIIELVPDERGQIECEFPLVDIEPSS